MRHPVRSSSARESCRWTCRFEPLEARFLLSVVPGGGPPLVTFGDWDIAPSELSGAVSSSVPIQSTRIDYRFEGSPQIEQLENGSIVTLDGEQTWVATGDAVVPVRDSSILLPQGTRIASVDVEYRDVGLNLGSGIQLIAAPIAVPNSGEFDSFDGWTTLVDTSMSQQDAVTFQNSTLAGYNVGTLRVFPVEYDVASGVLTYHRKVSVTVTVEEIGKNEMVGIRDLESDRQRVATLVDNPETLATYPSSTSSSSTWTSTSSPATTSLSGQYDYVVITSSALASSFQPLVDQKISRGLTATIMTTESISANYSGTETGDLADKIRHFISDAYINWGTQWVLLGGDTEVIPHRGVYGYVMTVSGGILDNNIPTDQYFACLDGSWNGDGDSVWGESNDGAGGGDVDMVSEVFIGRAPVSNTTEAANFVGKTVGYETTVHPNATTAVWLGELLNSEKGVYGSYSGIPIRDATIPDDWTLIEHYDSEGGWTRDDFVADLNASPHLINHLGHANEIYNARLYNNDVNALTNDYPYFMYSQGCKSGSFDTHNISIAEQHVVDDHGAFGVVMNTRYGFYTIGSVPTSSHYYAMEFWDAVFNEGLVHLGQANQDSQADNLFRVGSSGVYRWIHMETTLFGDPETSFQLEGSAPDTGEIHGTVWEDVDADGVYDSGESGMPDQWVYLDLNDNGVRDIGGIVSSTDIPVNIVDNTTVYSYTTVDGLTAISDLNVIFSITHSYDSDLIARLQSPSGTQLELFSYVGGSGENFTETKLDDEASTSINAAGAPFGGTYRPANLLSTFDGEDPNGTWVLEISDTATFDTGTLDSWSLEFSPDEPSATTDRNGIYSFTELANQTYRVRQVVPEGHFATSPTDSVHTVTISGGESHSGIDFLNTQQGASPDMVDLGVIDYLELEGLDLTSGDQWFTFVTTRGGTLTIQADFDGASNGLTMTLLNANQGVLAGSAPIDGGRRLDWDTEPGEVLLLRLTGELSDVSMRMANLVQTVGTQVTAYGTSGNDLFTFAPAAWHEFSVNGIDYTFKSQDIHSFVLEGGGGTNDTAELLTSAGGNDVAMLFPGLATLTGTSFDVTVNDVDYTKVISMGGLDVAHMYDSPSKDIFISTTEYSKLYGAGSTSQVEGFWYVHAYQRQGGGDIAYLFDSPGDDEYIGYPTYSRMLRADNFGNVRVKNFPVVHAYSEAGGNDLALLYDSPGNDTMASSSRAGLLKGAGFYNYVHSFATVDARATEGGFDTARLYDSPGDDWLKTTPVSAEFVGDQFLVMTAGFDNVTAYATAGGNDTAELYDSPDNETFIASPGRAVLSGDFFEVAAIQFDNVHSYGTSGGFDVAHLYDSPGNDTFEGFPTYGRLYGEGFYLRAKAFDGVHAYASQGYDKAYLFDSSSNDTFEGYQTYSRMYGNRFYNRAKFFETVYALAGRGGNDRIYMQDSSGNDRLDAAANWARLEYANNHTVYAYNFAKVNARATKGGNDVKQIESIDFVLRLYGDWTNV